MKYANATKAKYNLFTCGKDINDIPVDYFLATTSAMSQSNRLQGRVFFPNAKTKLVNKMKMYKDQRGQNSKPKVYEGFVILYPLDFTPPLRPTQNAVLTQKGMTFYPEVLPVTVGSTIYILNEDNEYHNVFSRTPGATFNIGRRPPGHMYPKESNLRDSFGCFATSTST